MRIIGVDFSNDYNSEKTGLALATACRSGENWGAKLEGVEKANPESAVKTVKTWIGQSPALIAIDAPLGWPEAMRTGLKGHEAGRGIETPAREGFIPRAGAPAAKDRVLKGIWTFDEEFFLRETDRGIWSQTRKKPLEVGADRIARTAYGALKFLQDLRETDTDFPLAWDAESVSPRSVIEVYPAATLKAHNLLPPGSYKKNKNKTDREEATKARARIVGLDPNAVGQQVSTKGIASKLEGIGEHWKKLLDNDDMLDAAVCVLAALDFLRGAARPPEDRDEAKREGWIWCKGIAQ